MAEQIATDSNSVIEAELDKTAEQLEKQLDMHILVYSGRITYGADLFIRNAIEWRKQQKLKNQKVAFFLETGGGYIEIAQRISTILRKNYRRVEFFVPDSAMSAGTVLVMSGDAIHMDYYSTLGPIDPQLPKPDNSGYVPAVGYLKKFADLMEKANKGQLSTAETTYLVTKFDPAELYQYEHARQLSVFLLEKWLAKYKFRNWKKTRTQKVPVTPSMRRDRAREIAEKLNDVEKWHSHGHGISMEVLRRDLNLQIEDYGKNRELWTLVRNFWSIHTDYMSRIGSRGVIYTKGRYRPIGWR